jgi:AbrB family looped-hinge helix DNA binding protein
MESVLSLKGQVTIPKMIRDHLHLKPGDRIKFLIHPDGSVVILPKRPIYALKGIVPAYKRSKSVDRPIVKKSSDRYLGGPSIRNHVKLTDPEPEPLKAIGEEARRNRTNALTSRQIDQIIKSTRAQKNAR